MWSDETYYTVERRTDENGDTVVLFVPEDGTYEIAGYCSVCGTRVSVSFTLEDAQKYTAGDAAWQKANADLASFFETYGFKFDFESYYPGYGTWDCTAGTKLEFTLTISGDTDEYTFDYWYGEDGTHVTEAMDEFLGEEKVTFTEDSLLGLGLYYVTGTVTPDGSGDPTTEVVYVYLMDPVYGTVCVYQLEAGDTINGSTVDSIDTTYENTFNNVTYDFDDELGIYFYQSTDVIGDDGIILTSEDEGYNDENNLFSAILAHTDCTSGPVAIGYFECATCGTKVPVYASAAHTFGDDGLDMTAPSTDSSDYKGYTVTINGVEYTYDTDKYVDADGNELELEAGSYTVVLALAEGYDAWDDGTTEKEYTFDVFSKMATAPTDPTTTYGDASTVFGYIEALFDTTDASWTVTIDGVEYTYSNEGGASYTDADGNELALEAINSPLR